MDRLLKNSQILNIMKICLVGVVIIIIIYLSFQRSTRVDIELFNRLQ